MEWSAKASGAWVFDSKVVGLGPARHPSRNGPNLGLTVVAHTAC